MPPRHARSRTRRPGRWLLPAVLVTTMAATLSPPLAPTATGADGDAIAVSTEIRLEGGGWGHGRGMSQWGAQGAASRGVGPEGILGFYYPQARLEAHSRGPIRVKLTAFRADVTVRVAAGVRLRDERSGTVVDTAALGAQLRVTADPAGLRLQHLRDGRWTDLPALGRSVGPVHVEGGTGLWLTQPDGAQREYRGVLTVHRSPAGLDVVNTLDLEHYLYGVVPRESPSWFAPAALRAQAVAARSYAWSNCSRGNPAYDVLDTTSCQVYGGRTLIQGGRTVALETAAAVAAVDATRHVVLREGGRTVRAEFSSSNGGRTAASPGAPARDDPFDGVDRRNGNHRWTTTVSAAAVRAAWPGVGQPHTIRLTRTGGGPFGGRVERVVLEGSQGRVDVSGGEFRSALGLRSTLFRAVEVRRTRPADVLVVTPGAQAGIASARPQPARPVTFSSGVAALGGVQPGEWRFFAAGGTSAGPPDLVAVRVRGGGSGRVEVHVLSGASGYRTFTVHAATPLPADLDPSQWQWGVASYRGSGRPDLYAFRTAGGGSGRAEVHVLSAASGYSRWVAHAATPLLAMTADRVTFLAGDERGRGAVTAILHGPTGSGRTEAHRLTADSGFRSFDLHAATALGPSTAGDYHFGLGDQDGDGIFDLHATDTEGTGSGTVELHVMAGRTRYGSWLTHAASNLPEAAGAIPVVRGG